MKKNILITGATGTTSQHAIKHLLDKDVNVRAMVRTIDTRSKKLEDMGVEIIQADFLDINSLRPALKGIDRAYFCYPFDDYLPKATGFFAKVAQEENLEMVVSMSHMGATLHSPSESAQDHAIAEHIMDWANIGAVHINPSIFTWSYLMFAAPTIADHNKFYFPETNTRFSIVHPEDVGEVVAGILVDEDKKKHIGKKYSLTSGTTHSNSEVSKEISEVINEDVEYVPITVEVWMESINKDPRINSLLKKHLSKFNEQVADGRFNSTTSIVKDITGHEPRTFKQYIEENIGHFKN
ncbi:MAG: NAD(P)H-binding protein [Psychroserpens sp.]|uniref:NmrA family NAD(P)-binding protein n=1 Tax=Psychroserpens sp. TaxID=2020870 RepID=UPI003002015F